MFLRIYEAMPVPVVVLDKDGHIVSANVKAEALFRLTGTDITSRTYDDPRWTITDFDGNAFSPEELPFAMVKRTSQPVSDIRHALQYEDGTRVLLQINGVPLFAENGSFDGMVASVEDITEQHRSTQALAESRAMLQSIFRAAPVGIGVVRRRMLTWTNQRLSEMVGYSESEFSGQSTRMLYPTDEDFEYVGKEKYRQISQNGTGTVETKWRCKDGRIIDVLLSSTPIDLEDFDKGVTFSALDITERNQMAEKLRQAHKMEAVGQLAVGIAHDFNNQLSGIVGYADLLRAAVSHDAELSRFAANIITGTKRAADLTGQRLAFARKGKSLSVPVDLHRVIFEVSSLLKHSIQKRIAVRRELNAHPSYTKGDPTQLQNMVLNLALNARDAMTDGGEFTIATNIETLTQHPIDDFVFDTAAGEYVRLDARDTGIGMDEMVRSKIFEPFFTTKENHKGTGLGLSAVWGTVKNHNDGIAVRSKVGEGTTVSIYLPLLREIQDTPPSSLSKEIVFNDRHILVVDDEQSVREVASDLLKSIGCRISTAVDGVDALRVYRETGQKIDGVILDLVMPQLDGKAAILCAQILESRNQGVARLRLFYQRRCQAASRCRDESVYPETVSAQQSQRKTRRSVRMSYTSLDGFCAKELL